MILSKFVINAVAAKLTKHFGLDKIMSYVFDENELDEKMKDVEARLNLLEKMAHPPKNLRCNCKEEK
tara:strand:+ start:210 stop:410 length:201 start_codon:yes stop_codon:yes gene_type:complete